MFKVEADVRLHGIAGTLRNDEALMSGRVLNHVDLPKNGGSIVLYDWSDMGDSYNLVRLDLEGNILWKAAPPIKSVPDCFTEISWDGKDLIANTWSCYRIGVDLQSGATTVLEFIK
ncbi:hypothetical protein QA648_24560 (plasmid) [Rhizobium sp. CB3171]|uniref:hypothetical protein n=1 Tax=Rhizobium sp. CB3171 TaxID=3039157 RepID=UPI0024B0C350|nr:hypothetical protein [Rhizobium sp. CB3171]WFU06284.1 hypothetical protein QA648_24560 [Rhizobium sp. CB3171]